MGNQELTCPDEQDLLLYLDDAEARPDVASHLDVCAACRARVDEHRAIDTLIACEEPLPAGLLERALSIPDRRTHRVRAYAVAVAALLLAGLGLRVLLPSKETVRPAHVAPVAVHVAEEAAPVNLDTRVRDALLQGDGEAIALLASLPDDALGVLHRIARGDDIEAARAAIVRLGEVGRRESLPLLRSALGRDATRDVAADALGSLGDPRAVADLEALLPDARARAAIVHIGGRQAVGALSRRLAVAGAAEGRALLAGIVQIDGMAGTRALLATLADPVHTAAAQGALEANEEGLLPHLLALAAAPRPDEARGALAAVERLAPASAVPDLERLLGRRDRRSDVARVLARIDTSPAHEALLGASAQPGIRAAFRLAGPGMEAHLLDGVASLSRHERLQRIDLLGLCGRERAVCVLRDLADDPAVAPHVVTALGRIGGAASVGVLGRLADRPALRRPAVDALGWTGAPEAVPVLVGLASAHPGLLGSVLRALAHHANSESVTAIARLDPRGTRAGRTLRGMDREIVLPALLALLDGDDAPAARRALHALGQPVPRARGLTARLD